MGKTGKFYFCVIFSCHCPSFNFWRWDCALGYVFSQILDVFVISYFPKIVNLTSFDNSWRSSETKFVILGIKVRFTCGESDHYHKIVKFQYIMTRIAATFFISSTRRIFTKLLMVSESSIQIKIRSHRTLAVIFLASAVIFKQRLLRRNKILQYLKNSQRYNIG